MSWQAQKLPKEYQEGSYKRRKSGKIINVGKPIKPLAAIYLGHLDVPVNLLTLPPSVPLQHFGEKNDMDTSLD